MSIHRLWIHRRYLTSSHLLGLLAVTTLVLVLPFAYGLDARVAHSPHSLWADAAQIRHPAAPGLQSPVLPWQQPDLNYRLFLPTMTNQFPERLLDIYDWYGNTQSWDWLVARFGAVWLQQGTGAAPVRVLREEANGQTALIAAVERAGQPLPGIPVMFYWPDAPWLDPSLRACGLDRALVVDTNSAGKAHFAMGNGSAYWPPGGGPHIVWVGGPGSDCLGGLGWLGGTNHIHLDSTWEVP